MTFTGNQLRAMRDAVEAGAAGAYIGLGSFIGEQSSALVKMGAAEVRSERQVGTTSRSSTDARKCEWDDLYLVATESGKMAYLAAKDRK